MLTTRPRGTNDILPDEVQIWQALENIIRNRFDIHGYHEIRTPIFEHTELFLRSVGESSDIVEKEMYSFEDKGLRNITLRPEGTAGTVRAFLENKLYAEAMPIKLFYIGPMFRYDQPQAGRYRQFHQFGCEFLGSNNPVVDAEIIALVVDIFSQLQLTNLTVKLNSVGCDKCRPAYHKALYDYFSEYRDELCPTCQKRLETNPMRILDCKDESCKRLAQKAPTTLEYICDDCKDHFEETKSYLDMVDIDYEIDTTLVRGLDYYTQTAFEVTMNSSTGQQNAICGGGRYNKLVADCGGQDTPGIGFAVGMERLIMYLKEQNIQLHAEKTLDVFLIGLGEEARKKMFRLARDLRSKNISTEIDYLDKGLKAQMKAADRCNAKYVVIVGDTELENEEAVFRDMSSSQQETVPFSNLISHIEEKVIECYH